MMKKALKLAIASVMAAGIAAPAAADILHRASVSGTVTYTEASNNGLSFADNTIGTNHRRHFFLEPEFEADFGVDATYRLHNTDTRAFVSYDHFSDKTDRQGSVLRNLNVAEGSIISNAEHRADEFRIGAKHTLHFGQRFDVTLNGFLEYQKAEREVFIRNADRTLSVMDEVRGFGPGFGATGRVVLFRDYPHWGLFGGMNASLLYADNEYSYRENNNATNPPTAVRYLTPEDSKSIVSKLDANLGIDYTRVVNSDMAKFLMSVALGVRYMNVVNAFKNGNTMWTSNISTVAPGAGYPIWTGSANDWGRFGPFLQFRIGGAEA